MVILKVLVGSRAHGLYTPDSDYDYRGVFVLPTTEFLRLNHKPKTTSWMEGDVDNTLWELGHFLHLSTMSNPTILETYVAPVEELRPYGQDLRDLFPYVWSAKRVRDAFIGYGLNQRKKFLEEKDKRPNKYAVAYLRTLWQGYMLLRTGELIVDMRNTVVYEPLLRWKYEGPESKGEVIDLCEIWAKELEKAYEDHGPKEPDYDRIYEFYHRVRREFWDGEKS